VAKLYGPDGRLYQPEPRERPLADFLTATSPAVRDRGAYVEIDKEALAAFRKEKSRRLAVTGVPSTPRHLIRDVGGAAVGKGYGRWPHVTMDMLRDQREKAPILQPIHNARNYQVRRMAIPWGGAPTDVGIRVVHKNHTNQKAVQPEGFERYIAQAESILWKPCPSYGVNTLGTFLSLLMEDFLTINHPVVEPIYSKIDSRRIVQWRPVDGGIIWPTLLFVEKWVADNPRWNAGYDSGRIYEADVIDILSGIMQADIGMAEFVCVRDGLVEAIYPPGRLICAPNMNRTDVRFAGYPPSHVEQALSLIAAFISTFQYNADYFTKGMLAEFILGIPAAMHEDDVDAFVDMFRESSQGVKRAHQPPILPIPAGSDKIQKIDLKAPNKDMMFEIWLSLLLSLCTAVYRMDPSSINAKPWDSGGGPKLSEGGGRAEEIALAKEEGLQGDLGHLIDNVLNPLVMRCHPDLRVIAEYGDYDAQKEASINEIRCRTHITRNELRIEQGKDPMGFCLISREEYDAATREDQEKHEDNPWNWPTDTVFATAISGAKQREQQAQMMQQQQQQQPGQDPSQGSPDGYGGSDDGYGGSHPSQDPSPYGSPDGQPLAKASSRTVHVHLHGPRTTQ
jgi:hypothetical protein